MGGSAWKVAYADFVTAMMAFFLLMWILNMSTDEQKAGLAQFFTEGATGVTNVVSPVGLMNVNPLMLTPGKLTTEQMEKQEMQRNTLAILRSLKAEIAEDSMGRVTTGLNTSGNGVMLQVVPDIFFQPGTTTLSPAAKTMLDRVYDIMKRYQTYLVVRGHTDLSETGAPNFPSAWELSAARGNAAVEYLIQKGINPKLVRSVAYGNTQPAVPPSVANAVELNGRVEFNFHRPEVMSTISNF